MQYSKKNPEHPSCPLLSRSSSAQGIENPVFEALPAGSVEPRPRPQLSYLASRQPSESGRHLLSEPNTPLSPPGPGDCFFPTLGECPSSPPRGGSEGSTGGEGRMDCCPGGYLVQLGIPQAALTPLSASFSRPRSRLAEFLESLKRLVAKATEEASELWPHQEAAWPGRAAAPTTNHGKFRKISI